jgi:large subunit ribosomal protein L10
MKKDQKIEITAEIKDLINGSDALYFTDFTGLTVSDVNEFRDELYKSNIQYKVVKNTLITRALKESGKYSGQNDKLFESLKGPTGIIFAKDDPVTPAKIIKKFFDKSEKPKLKMAVIESEVFASKSLDALASMQTKEEVMSSIIGSIQSPISGIVGAINAVMRDISYVIEEVAKKNAT